MESDDERGTGARECAPPIAVGLNPCLSDRAGKDYRSDFVPLSAILETEVRMEDTLSSLSISVRRSYAE